jgi:hypothetical protein
VAGNRQESVSVSDDTGRFDLSTLVCAWVGAPSGARHARESPAPITRSQSAGANIATGTHRPDSVPGVVQPNSADDEDGEVVQASLMVLVFSGFIWR